MSYGSNCSFLLRLDYHVHGGLPLMEVWQTVKILLAFCKQLELPLGLVMLLYGVASQCSRKGGRVRDSRVTPGL